MKYHSVRYPSVIRKRVTVNSFKGGLSEYGDDCQDISKASKCYNFNAESGSLTCGEGVLEFGNFNYSALGENKILGVYFYKRYDYFLDERDDRIIVYASDGYLYYALASGGRFTRISSMIFNEKPIAIQYDYLDSDVLLLSTLKDGLYYLDGSKITKIEGAPNVTSLAVHYERLFVTVSGEGSSLWFSDDFNPTNWTVSLDEAGFIDFADERGKLLKVLSFLDYVYVFREYGITRVAAYSEQETFSSANLFGKQGKIYGGSVTDCGDFVIMLTSSGFFRFNGIDTYKAFNEYDRFLKDVNNENAKGIYVGTKLYMLMDMIIDVEPEKVVFVYDTAKNNSYIIRGALVDDMAFAAGDVNKLITVSNQEMKVGYFCEGGKNYGETLSKVWESPKSDFGVQVKQKRIYKAIVNTNEPIIFTIYSQNEEVSYELDGGGICEVKPNISGEWFKVRIESNSNQPNISNVSLYLEYLKE